MEYQHFDRHVAETKEITTSSHKSWHFQRNINTSARKRARVNLGTTRELGQPGNPGTTRELNGNLGLVSATTKLRKPMEYQHFYINVAET